MKETVRGGDEGTKRAGDPKRMSGEYLVLGPRSSVKDVKNLSAIPN